MVIISTLQKRKPRLCEVEKLVPGLTDIKSVCLWWGRGVGGQNFFLPIFFIPQTCNPSIPNFQKTNNDLRIH